MIKIKKGKEPNAWSEHRNTPGAVYDAIPELRASLLLEQGYICAYCMSRIDEGSSKIEHLKCRSRYPSLSMQYKNMVICCPGNSNNGFQCDKSKGDSDISFTLFNDHFINTLSYETKNGRIKSSNTQWNDELDTILNLNNLSLMLNRKNTIEGVIEALKRKGFDRHRLSSELNKWKNPDKNNKMKEFCGVVIWYISKRFCRHTGYGN